MLPIVIKSQAWEQVRQAAKYETLHQVKWQITAPNSNSSPQQQSNAVREALGKHSESKPV